MSIPIYRLRMVGDYLLPIWSKQATVRIEGTYGFTPLPTAVKQACVMQAAACSSALTAPRLCRLF
jgi:hypothetical protein